jgi:hypothetical protein
VEDEYVHPQSQPYHSALMDKLYTLKVKLARLAGEPLPEDTEN